MLTNSEIKKQMQAGNIMIENMANGALNKPNSCDIRIGNTLYVHENVIDLRYASSYMEEVMKDKPISLKKIQIPETGLLLEPNKIYLSKTIETIETHGYVPAMYGKASLSLLGVNINMNNGIKHDEYNGSLLLSISVTKPTIIYPDIKIGNLSFFPSLDPSPKIRNLDSGLQCGVYPYGMLSGSEIKKRMSSPKPDIYIDNTQGIVINPNSINLTLNENLAYYSSEILDIKKENNLKQLHIEDKIKLEPNEIYVARTNEWTEINNLIPMMSGRSSLGRNGIYVHNSAGMGSIGYKGYWRLGIRVIHPIWIVKDLKCCQIYFYNAVGQIENQYSGIMQDLPKEELGSQLHRILKKD